MKLKILFFMILAAAVSFQAAAAPKKAKQEIKKEVQKFDFEISGSKPLNEAVMPLLPKKSQLAHSITEGVFGPADGKKGSNLNVIYSTADKTPEIMVLTPAAPGKYMKNKPEALNFPVKGKVEVLSVFFDQADKDIPRELFVLCAITEKDKTSYQTAVFDWTPKGFVRMPKIESQVKDLYPSLKVRRILPQVAGK